MRARRLVSFVTDLEGDLSHFRRFVRASRVVAFRDAAESVLTFRTGPGEEGFFVHGGDLFDRGPGDVRLSRMLCDFKDRHPEHVFLLLGNRDINKMRFSSELNLDVAPAACFRAWWDDKAPSYAEYLDAGRLTDSVEQRLRWMLQHTLGCPHTFELRRTELSELSGGAVSDADVVQSFLDGVLREDGFYYAYLQRGQLALKLGDALFVHGATDPRGLGWVPDLSVAFVANAPEDVKGTEVPDLDEWVRQLNAFKTRALSEWRGDGLRWRNGRRGGDALLMYQNKQACQNRTVCVSNFVDGKNMPLEEAFLGGGKSRVSQYELRVNPVDPKAWEYLRRGGVRRVFVGHTPAGNACAVLRTEDGREVVTADLNYATPAGDRGENLCEVLLEGDRTQLRGEWEGASHPYSCYVDEAPIGTQVLYDGQRYWCKLRLNDGRLLLSRGAGRVSTDVLVSASDCTT